MIRYCLPSSIHVDGPLLTGDVSRWFHRIFPLAGSNATRCPESPVNNSFPAVVRIPPDTPPPPNPCCGCSCFHFTAPVRTSSASSAERLSKFPPPPPPYPSGLSDVS